VQSNISFFFSFSSFHFSTTIHLNLAKRMHWENERRGRGSLFLIAGQIWGSESERHRKAKQGMAVFFPHRVNPSLFTSAIQAFLFQVPEAARETDTRHSHHHSHFQVLENLEEEETFHRSKKDGFDFDATHM
jgi:hypothetical protein